MTFFSLRRVSVQTTLAMSTPRPTRRIVPTAKLTADNAGELELTSHRRAVVSASMQSSVVSTASDLVCRPAPTSSPLPESSPPPLTDTEDTSSVADPQARGSSKRSSYRTVKSTLSNNSIITISTSASASDDVDLVALETFDSMHKLKKAKISPPSGVDDVSIINIDDIQDPEDEPLNRSDPTADLKFFFTPTPRLPGQAKGRMRCYLCL